MTKRRQCRLMVSAVKAADSGKLPRRDGMREAILDYLAERLFRVWELPVRVWHRCFGHGETAFLGICWACGDVAEGG